MGYYSKFKPNKPAFTKKEQLKFIKKFDSDQKELAKDCHALWREIVFLKANYKCEYFGCYREATQPHHIFTKGHTSQLKYDPENGMALCYLHHKGSNDAAHCDINFKDKILGKYPGYKAIRDEQWFILLERKAECTQKLDLKMEFLYLQNELKKIKELKGR